MSVKGSARYVHSIEIGIGILGVALTLSASLVFGFWSVGFVLGSFSACGLSWSQTCDI